MPLRSPEQPAHPNAYPLTGKEVFLKYHLPNILDSITHNFTGTLRALDPRTNIGRIGFASAAVGGLSALDVALEFAQGKPVISSVLAQEDGIENSAILSSVLSDGDVVVEMSSAPLTSPVDNPFYKPEIRLFDGKWVATRDGNVITHEADENGNWQEIENYIPIGTAQERVNRNLENLLGTNKLAINGQTFDNPLGLDSNEVKKYLETGSDIGLKSFQILRNSKGEPAIILVTGGQYGFNEDLGNIDAIKQTVKQLNTIDPSIMDTLTIKFGVRALSADIAPGKLFSRLPSNFAATYDSLLGIIINKENDEPQLLPTLIARILVEGRGIYSQHHLVEAFPHYEVAAPDEFDNNELMDKALWFKGWVKKNEGKLDPLLYKQLMGYADFFISYS